MIRNSRKTAAAAIAIAFSIVSTHASASTPGSLDAAFGSMSNGSEVVSFAPASAVGEASAVAADGSIYLGGSVIVQPDKVDIGVARLSPNGRFDPDFGAVQLAVAGYAAAAFKGMVVQPDGKLVGVGLVATGPESTRWLVCRLLVDGTVDETFGDVQTPGCTSPLVGQAVSVGLQSDGRLIVVGNDAFEGASRAVMLRLEPDGAMDMSFAANVSLVLLPSELDAPSTFKALVVSDDDGIAVTGSYGATGETQFMVAKFTADGVLRNEFSQDGVRVVSFKLLPPGERYNESNALAVLADGSVILSGVVYVPTDGGSTSRIGVVKLRPDGELSPDFSSTSLPDGQLLIDPCVKPCSIVTHGMHVLADGRVLLAGSVSLDGQEATSLHSIRLLPDGQLDPGYSASNDGEFLPGISLVGWDAFDPETTLMQGDRLVMVGTVQTAQGTTNVGALRIVADGVFADGLEAD